MRTEVTRELVRFSARICGWPPVQVGNVTLADAGAWKYAIEHAAAVERAELLVKLQAELMASSEAGRRRLAQQRDLLPWTADTEPFVVGDLTAVPIIKAALALIPPAARHSLIRETVFYCTGSLSPAFTCSARPIDSGGREKSIAIHLGPDLDVARVLHELAHAYHKRIHEDSQAVSAEGEAAFIEHMVAVDPGRIERWERSAELLADATALSWLYAGAGVLAG